MTEYSQEQAMEIQALEAILMDDFKEIHSGESGLNTSNRCFQITLSPQDDELDESSTTPVQLGLIFSHTEKYPDEPPLLNVKSIRGIQVNDLRTLKEKLEQEASENLGMPMIYTLVTSAQELLSGIFCEDVNAENVEEEVAKVDVIIPHGEPVTVETFLTWRERLEAELALEQAKLMPESALSAHKEKKVSGRQWFDQSGRAKGALPANEGTDDEEDDDLEDDEEDMLEHYLAEKSDSSHAT
ncbi:RWD domain-containing protein 1 [Tripterygium wilfordii]|uniref:RWD domain-containing protein 1 n=1 Tax=Tripterygium wilfordii TaxID=458696 RepID=A0A7J7E0I9_TRIWF|nr:RWD domain-containing protein 1-like [Tripterygium wilfordii]XP_038715533.1 RWD domain-containing protein 1-like [Tripterygium wilfordii]XP_038715540.1 RWD domain-containing protein 1-like [Tripterygium wilfordii]XP_038715547.1 RWD domain-containing protein 1-like [Tripterygium wilfordii]XP_038715554.1 RWD domain-containing protein 1-like [Tripterygium wilfordii]KAF5751836.1 RWD domain-containing protein 1 [Tripterygium wilfordii]